MKIHSTFDAGNITVISAENPNDIQLAIRRDKHADYKQWFYFRVSQAEKICHQFKLLNIRETSYPNAWDNGSIVASYDRQHWFRVPTEITDDNLLFELTPEHNIVYFAYFAPYSYQRHQDLIARVLQYPSCILLDTTNTVEGRQIELLQIGEPLANKKKIWFIARQHPGETMAQWYIEGLLERLLDSDDAIAKSLLDKATFYVVPNMNPDGSVAGNLRTNGAGTDLNRAWLEPSIETSPEVLFVRNKMDDTGVDLFLDIHGDEEISYVFAAGAEGNPSYTEHIHQLDIDFRKQYHAVNPDFRQENGYPVSKPGEGNLRIACNQVGERFNCLSLTIEMPFKDNQFLPDELYGWSPKRSIKLGASVLTPIHMLLDRLR